MKLSYEWLKKYVALPEDLTMEQLAYDLTMRTVEVEGTTDLAKQYEGIVAGKILSVSPHPDADRMRVVQVDVGDGEPKQIVCGGVNLIEGHFVAVNLPGSYAVWHGQGEPVQIDQTELRGVASYGMISGPAEIGLADLFPDKPDHWIVDFTEALPEEAGTLSPGTPVADFLGLNDQILEIENKSITNRPDLWGHYGVARELAAIYEKPLAPLPEQPELPTAAYPVRIEAEDLCHRFVAAEYTGVDARKAPLWLQVALMKVDIRPINALVDITNYVMMTFGQPTHAYDAKHLRGGIVVRRAQEGEALELLDGKELTLHPENLVIADEEKAIGLAGAMGGKHDSILPDTTSLVFESANFNAQSVRKTAQTFGIRTEASTRFEKGIDTQRIDPTFALADQMLTEIFPELKKVSFTDAVAEETVREELRVSSGWLARRLGREMPAEEMKTLLERLGFAVTLEGADAETMLDIVVPSWRSTGDVSLADDILEEVARMIGYENFEMVAPSVRLTGPVNQRKLTLERRIMEYFAFRGGFQEITSYPWVEEDTARLVGEDLSSMLTMDQPPAPTQSHLRASHVPNLLDAIVKNVRFFEAFSLFEAGQVYQKGESHPSTEEETLPAMHRELAGAMVGQDPAALFYQVKGVLEGLGESVQTYPITFRQEKKPAWADRDGWLTLYANGETVGYMGLLSNRVRRKAGLKFQDACLFVLNLEKLVPLDSRTNQFTALPQYPHVFQDLSLLADDALLWKDMTKAIGNLAVSVEFIDEYRGKQIPEGKKSVTLRVELASDEGTMTAEEINEKMQRVREALAGVGATVREM